MQFSAIFSPARLVATTAALALLAGCDEPLDLDLRGKIGAFSTSQAAQKATASRPEPDDRGIIAYPNYQVAVARRGDSVTDVARRINMPAGELANYNGLEADVKLRDGEVLALPRRVAEPSPETGAVDIASIAGTAIDSAPDTTPVTTTALAPAKTETVKKPSQASEPLRHKVERGETAYTISRLYQVPVKSLAEWNGLGSDFSIREGQYLLIPVTGATPPKRPLETVATAAKPEQPGTGSITPTPPSATKPLPTQTVAVKPPEAPKVDVGKPTLDTNTAAMQFPVKGKIIRAYSKGRNEGIDIAAAAGSAVSAAADGSVAAITSSADKVPIVVVRHPDNLLTVYANVDNIKVKKGDAIKRGQQLASLRSGDNAYVHFEVRNGFDSVDPLPYLE